MKTKNALLALWLLLASSLTTAAFAVSTVTLPTNPKDLVSAPVASFKTYPDIKVALGKKLTEADLRGKSETELSLMRNSIYAQTGFKFTETWLANYFNSRSWYKESDKANYKILTAVDHANAKQIYDYQKAHTLLTVFAVPNKKEDKHGAVFAASQTPAAEWRGSAAALRKNLLAMRICKLNVSGEEIGISYTFHHNNVVTEKHLSPNVDPYGEAYDQQSKGDSAYGNAYGSNASDSAYGSSAYGNAYGPYGSSASDKKGTWKIGADNRVSVSFSKTTSKLYFGEKSFSKQQCFMDKSDIQ